MGIQVAPGVPNEEPCDASSPNIRHQKSDSEFASESATVLLQTVVHLPHACTWVSVQCTAWSALGSLLQFSSPTIGNLYPRFSGPPCKVAAPGKMTPSGQTGAKTFPPCANSDNDSALLGDGMQHSPVGLSYLLISGLRTWNRGTQVYSSICCKPVRRRYDHSWSDL